MMFEGYGPVQLEEVSFNDGALFVDLESWRGQRVSKVVLDLMTAHHNAPGGLWKYGTQAISQLLASRYGWVKLGNRFYCGDLGFKEKTCPSEAVFYHFNGERKPWLH